MPDTPSNINTVNDNVSVLIIEEDSPAATLLPLTVYFEALGWQVHIAHTGENAFAQIERNLPDAVLLNPALPGMDGFEVCQRIRANFKTRLMPVIFSHTADRDIKLKGLSCGADEHQEIYEINGKIYFDPEGMKLSILQLAATSKGYGRLAITDLPTREYTETRIGELIQQKDWALLDVSMGAFDEYEEAFGFLAAYDLLRLTADLIKNVLSILGLGRQFVGHLETSRFIILVPEKQANDLNTKLKERFFAEIHPFCRSMERELEIGSTDTEPFNTALLNLAIGVVLGSERDFTDIKSLLDLADERRRADRAALIFNPASLIEQRLQQLQSRQGWALLNLQIRHFEAFCEIYDEAAAKNIVFTLQGLITETLNALSPDLQSIDRAEGNRFWVIVSAASAPQVREHLKHRFADMAFAQYYYIHQQEGFIRRNNGDKEDLMDLAVGICVPGETTDANAVLKMAEDAARIDQ